ncbi:hypothetical protein HDV05_006660 [Chytridiales sp. JEL 0842]|nr:hypothetical protein HDV05_006660 [Chytridiales sp. JEL 0842]
MKQMETVEELNSEANKVLKQMMLSKEIPFVVFSEEVEGKDVWKFVILKLDIKAFCEIDDEYKWWNVNGAVNALWQSIVQIVRILFPTVSLPPTTHLAELNPSTSNVIAASSLSQAPQTLLPFHFLLYNAFYKARWKLGIKGKTTKAETLRFIFEKLEKCSSLGNFDSKIVDAFVTKMKAQSAKTKKRRNQKEKKKKEKGGVKSNADESDSEEILESGEEEEEEERGQNNSGAREQSSNSKEQSHLWVSCDEVSGLSYEGDLLNPLIRSAAGVVPIAPINSVNAVNLLNPTKCRFTFAVNEGNELTLEVTDSDQAITALRALLKRYQIMAVPELNKTARESVGCLVWSFASLARNSLQPTDELLTAFQTTSANKDDRTTLFRLPCHKVFDKLQRCHLLQVGHDLVPLQ